VLDHDEPGFWERTAAEAFAGNLVPKDGVRLGRARVMRDCGMFDRREATQYHPKVQRYERYNVVPRRMQLSPDRHRVDILPSDTHTIREFSQDNDRLAWCSVCSNTTR
jgi:hypothetical protein